MPEKQIWFVRHGLSRANVPEIAQREFLNSHNNDAHLHPHGIEQAANQTLDIPADAHIMTSPLTRAMDTCVLGLIGKGTRKIVLCPWIAEYLADITCVGMRKTRLESKCGVLAKLTGHEFDLSLMTDEFWWDDGTITDGGHAQDFNKSSQQFFARMQKFIDYVKNRPETTIVVFSHGIFIHEFLKAFSNIKDHHPPNCGLIIFNCNIHA